MITAETALIILCGFNALVLGSMAVPPHNPRLQEYFLYSSVTMKLLRKYKVGWISLAISTAMLVFSFGDVLLFFLGLSTAIITVFAIEVVLKDWFKIDF